MQRVSNSMMYNGMLTDTYNNLNRLMDLNKQLSTGKLHQKPSDAPLEVTRELSLSTTIYENEQYMSNMEDGLTWLKNSDTAFAQIGDMTERVRELAVRSGSGALDDSEMEAIAQELEQLQEGIMEAANYSVEGRYLLSGAATSVVPFERDDEGNVAYMGNDNKVQYEMDRGIVSDVSFTGREVFPEYYTQHSLESVDVPLDFKWSGRNEIIQFQVGDRSVKVRIPEDSWSDNDNASNSSDTDYNRFRDPAELSSMTLDEIASTIENSMNMGDAGRLVSVDVIKDTDAGTQRLEIRSHTGDPISITSWPETDSYPMNEAIVSIKTDADDSVVGGYVLPSDGSLDISVGAGEIITVDLQSADTLDDMARKISSQDGLYGKVVGAGTANAYLSVISTDPDVSINLTAEGGATDLFGTDSLPSKAVSVPHDQSHIDLMSLLGMETSLKSSEIETDSPVVESLSDSNKVHWYLDGGDDHAEVLINSGPDMTLEELATEIKAVAGDWLEVIVQTDPGDNISSNMSMDNEEDGTSRLILRSRDGGPVNVLDLAPDSTAGMKNTQLAQSLGLSTAVYASNTTTPTFPTGDILDSRMPARMEVTVGDRSYDVKLYKDDIADSSGVVDVEKMMEQIQSQVGTGEDGEYLVQYKALSGATGQPAVAAYSHTGEPISFVDLPFGDPAVGDYSGGIAMSTGISSGITGDAVLETLAVDTGSSGTFKVETMGHSMNVSVAAGDTLKDVAEKLEKYAGDWLNIAYLDTNLNIDTNTVQLSISSKDGSPVNITDLEEVTMNDSFTGGAASAFGISTGIRGADLADIVGINTPAVGHELSIKVDGYTHTMDLRQLDLDGNNNLEISELEKLPDLINARFQGQDVKAELYTDSAGDSHILINSPRGSSIEVSGSLADDILGATNLTTTKRSTSASPQDQQVVKRSSSDYKKTDFFGLMDDLIDAVRQQDRDGISTLLGDIDDGIDALLKVRTQEGALVNRYDSTKTRLTQNNLNYTELYSSIADTDIAKASMEYMSAQSVYQAGLSTIAKIIQPTLVDFL